MLVFIENHYFWPSNLRVMINITFPDGQVKQYESGISAYDIAFGISEGLARNILSASVNGKVQDLMRPITEDAEIIFHKWEDKEGNKRYTTEIVASQMKMLGAREGGDAYKPAGPAQVPEYDGPPLPETKDDDIPF